MAAPGDPNKRRNLRIFSSLDDLTIELAEYIAHVSEISVKERGDFAVALSGRLLITLLGKLAETPYLYTVDWSKWHVFFVEERAVAKNHVDSNYKLAKEAFLSKVPVTSGHICSINDNASVEIAAQDYEFAMRQLVKLRIIDVSMSNDCPRFDLILLEMGAEGHVAALFPLHPALNVREDWVTYIVDSPQPPPERITFTLPVINSALNVVIVATGTDKAEAVSRAVMENCNLSTASSPASMVDPTDGELVWFLDSSAASKLELAEADKAEI